MTINIITRQMWRAFEPRKEELLMCPPNNVFLMNVRFATCSTRTHCSMLVNNTQRFNARTGTLRDIRHNFIIGGDGNVYEGRGWYAAPLVPKEYYNTPDSLIIGFLGNFSKASMLNIVSRNMWLARQARLETPTRSPFHHVYLMNAPRDYCFTRAQCLSNVMRMQDFHMSIQNQRDIRYNFLVGGDGSVYEGRGWEVVPMLPLRYSEYQDSSMIIGFIGEFTDENMPSHMQQAGQDLINYGVQQGHIATEFEVHDIMKKPEFHRQQFAQAIDYNQPNRPQPPERTYNEHQNGYRQQEYSR